MNKVYDDTNEEPFVVGELYHDGDWREFITTTMDSKGFHYLYVALNNYEKYTNRSKGYYQPYGWVIYESPYVKYDFSDKVTKIIRDKKEPSTHLILYSDMCDSPGYKHYSSSKQYK